MPERRQGHPLSVSADGLRCGQRAGRQQGPLGCAPGSSCARIPLNMKAVADYELVPDAVIPIEQAAAAIETATRFVACIVALLA